MREMLSALVPLLAPLLTGAMGALGILVKDRRKRKSRDHQLRRAIEFGQAEVQFIDAWIQARQLLGPLGRESRPAQEWLNRCYAAVESAQAEVTQAEVAPRTQIPVIRRMLLLRPMRGASTQVCRILFWMAFLICNLSVIGFVSEVVNWLQGEPKTGEDIFAFAFWVVVFGAVAARVRIVAVHREKGKK